MIAAVFLLPYAAPRTAAASAIGVTIQYSAGWNLVGGPEGTVFGTSGSMYTLRAGDAGYQSFAGGAPTAGGIGYWAYSSAATEVTLNGAGVAQVEAAVPAGRFVMVGNPSGTQSVNITGADQALAYDTATAQYRATTTLAVGQGAWVYSAAGGAVTLTATGVALALPATAGSGEAQCPAGPVAVTYLRSERENPVGPVGYVRYIFSVTGFRVTDLSPTQLKTAVTVTGPNGNPYYELFTSPDAPCELQVRMVPGLGQGTFTLSIALPDGRSAQTTFTIPP